MIEIPLAVIAILGITLIVAFPLAYLIGRRHGLELAEALLRDKPLRCSRVERRPS